MALWVVLAVLAAAPPSQAAKAPAHDCGPRSATTVSRNHLVRLYSVKTRNGSKDYYACTPPNGTPYAIGSSPDKVLLRGRYVTDVANFCDSAGCWFHFTVVDVVRREQVEGESFLAGTARKLVATANREAAVLALSQDGSERYILKFDAMGHSEVDRGPDVRELTLRDRFLHWMSGAEARTAPIAHLRRCGPTRHTESEALGPRIRVYSVYVSISDGDEEYEDYYACLRPGGKPLKIARLDVTVYSGSGSDAAYIPRFVFTGDFAAFAVVACTFDDCVSDFRVFDVRRRLRIHKAGNIPGSVDTIVLSPAGQAGALVSNDAESPTVQYVLAFDSTGKHELDRGPDVRDLTLDGSRLRWFNGSEARSAELR